MSAVKERRLTPAQVGQILSCGRQKVITLILLGQLPAENVGSTTSKNGARYLIKQSDVTRWLESRRVA